MSLRSRPSSWIAISTPCLLASTTPTLTDEHLRALCFLAELRRGRTELHHGAARPPRPCGACQAASRKRPREVPGEDHQGRPAGARGDRAAGLKCGTPATAPGDAFPYRRRPFEHRSLGAAVTGQVRPRLRVTDHTRRNSSTGTRPQSIMMPSAPRAVRENGRMRRRTRMAGRRRRPKEETNLYRRRLSNTDRSGRRDRTRSCPVMRAGW
jgi:hypothetical protein